MKRTIIGALILSAVWTAGAVAATPSSNDTDFIQSAQHEALGEYALAALARGKAEDPAAKALAQQIATNAASVNDFIRSYARTHGISLDNKPSLRADEQYGNIQGDKGAQFDKDYANALHIDLNIASSNYQDETTGGSDPALKAFAKKQLAILEHFDQAAGHITR